MDTTLAHKTWRTAEPIHAMIYFVEEAKEEYDALGLTAPRMGYFASRGAPLGAASAELVVATFFNFNPELVRRVIPSAWDIATPEAIVAARFRAADRALRRGLGEAIGSPSLRRASQLARQAAEGAMEHLEGRPLFAAHAHLEWPEDDHLVLWHAQTLLREFRGDGHIVALIEAELDPLEALVTHEAVGVWPSGVLLSSRAWSIEQWNEACDRLRERGLLETQDAPMLTTQGQALRQHVEDRTDQLSLAPYRALGDDGCNELRELTRPLSRAIVDGGMLSLATALFEE